MDEFEQLQIEKEQSSLKKSNIQEQTQIMSGSMQQPLNMQQDMLLDANHIQVEKNLQQLEDEVNLELLTDAQREKNIEKAYEAHKKGTKLNTLDKKGKRAKSMKKKVEYRKKAKAFKLPKPTNLGKLIDEAGFIDPASVVNEARTLESIIKSLKIKDDEAFSSNLESNFKMFNWLDRVKAVYCKAVSVKIIRDLNVKDSKRIRTVIAMGEQVKKYMIAQQQLMQNPYYTMLAKKDVAGLSGEELVKKANAVKAVNPTLAEYYLKVLEVRNSGFERAKGMSVAYKNASKLVDKNKDNIDVLLESGKTKLQQYRKERIKKKNEKKFAERVKKAEEAKRKREEKEKDPEFQEIKKQFADEYRPKYKMVEESNRKLENLDPEISEYKILNSYDLWEQIQKNPANDMNTDEYEQIYGNNFQYLGTRSDSAYVKTGNAFILNMYIRNREEGLLEKRKWYARFIPDEMEIEKRLEEWEDEIKDTIALLKQNTKRDSIPQKCRLFRMCGDYVLKNLGLDTAKYLKNNKQELVNQLNKLQGMTFKEKNFSSTAYRGDGDYDGVLKQPVMLTILCEKGQKCFITANQREAEIIFDKPEFEIVKAELADENHPKRIPLSSGALVHNNYGIDFSSETTSEYTGGINLVVRLKRSDGDDPNA